MGRLLGNVERGWKLPACGYCIGASAYWSASRTVTGLPVSPALRVSVVTTRVTPGLSASSSAARKSCGSSLPTLAGERELHPVEAVGVDFGEAVGGGFGDGAGDIDGS
jgi:hypothetical protein